MNLRPPREFFLRARRAGVHPTPDLLLVSVLEQRVTWFRAGDATGRRDARAFSGFRMLRRPASLHYRPWRRFVASTSRLGTGQIADSNQTPLGLHRIARKVGAGWPVGTVFEGRRATGLTWDGRPDAAIAHRILWLEGLERGFNRGGRCDSFARYIYIHGVGDELTLGQPASRGCIHLAAADLMPLFETILPGTLVWICGGGNSSADRS